jgi:hypothetical protein
MAMTTCMTKNRSRTTSAPPELAPAGNQHGLQQVLLLAAAGTLQMAVPFQLPQVRVPTCAGNQDSSEDRWAL